MDVKFSKKFKIDELSVFSNDSWTWSVRPKQVTLGSGILSLKRECEKFGELTDKEFKDLGLITRVIEKTLKIAFCYDNINYLMLMMVDKQVHFHIIPRYSKQTQFDGQQWIDTSYPFPPNLSLINNSSTKLLSITNHIKNNLINESQLKKYKIGYTTGVFDMFHIGHLNLIMRAKEQCDYLIVGVTTDELVSYKNKKAIIPHVERMKIVEGCKFVDKVVSQESMDKMAAWEKYQFDVMFVGSDWKGTPKWTELERQFKEVKVDIVYFPYTAGTSSTVLREALDKMLK